MIKDEIKLNDWDKKQIKNYGYVEYMNYLIIDKGKFPNIMNVFPPTKILKEKSLGDCTL